MPRRGSTNDRLVLLSDHGEEGDEDRQRHPWYAEADFSPIFLKKQVSQADPKITRKRRRRRNGYCRPNLEKRRTAVIRFRHDFVIPKAQISESLHRE
jgi:hypothetical protein